jgi:hypothetical protein
MTSRHGHLHDLVARKAQLRTGKWKMLQVTAVTHCANNVDVLREVANANCILFVISKMQEMHITESNGDYTGP